MEWSDHRKTNAETHWLALSAPWTTMRPDSASIDAVKNEILRAEGGWLAPLTRN